MPNHVTHKIIFEASKADEIFAAVCPGGRFDFNTLIPEPAHLYKGDVSSEDEQDFPCNWYIWNKENWGTKWNAYDCSISVEGEIAYIKFDTAWNIPYPIISAFANRFQIPFEHRYFDEGHNYWGIEKWGTDVMCDFIHRINKSKNTPEHERPLHIELKGYDMAEDEEDNAAEQSLAADEPTARR